MKAETNRLKTRITQNVGTVEFAVEEKLESELERLKQTLNLGYELRVKWVPNGNVKLSGEVRGDRIYIYDEDEAEALETLRHEFLDYAISNIIEPYKQVTNKLISLINEEAYKGKERLVERLSTLLTRQAQHDF
jgi:hypothetical protein